jgi:hypothetical protein
MWLLILKIAGIALIVLLLLYLLTRRFPAFGDSLAFLCVVIVRLFVKGQWGFQTAAAYCYDVFTNSLNYPPNVTNECWYGLYVFARLVYLILGAGTLIAETVNTMLMLPALLGTTQAVQLPGNVEAASGILIMAVPGLFGCIVLECCRLIPYGAGLFPHMGKITRWILGLTSLVCMIGAILVIGDLYVFRAAYIDNPDSTQGMTIALLGGLGVLVATVAVFAVWACCVGLVGLASIVAWLAAFLCQDIAYLFALLPSLFDVLAVHLSDGRMSVYQPLSPVEPYQVPGPVSSPPQKKSLSGMTNDTGQSRLEITMATEAHVSIVCGGPLGSRYYEPLVTAAAHPTTGCGSITHALVDLHGDHSRIGIKGDLSPLVEERGSFPLSVTTSRLESYQQLFTVVGERQQQEHSAERGLSALFLYVLDTSVLFAVDEMLEKIHTYFPHHGLIVYTSVSQQDVRKEEVQQKLRLLKERHAQGKIITTIVADPSCDVVKAYGEDVFIQDVTKALVGLLIGQKQSGYGWTNHTGEEDLHRLFQDAPFVGLAVDSDTVGVGPVPKRWSWLRLFTKNVGVGEVATLANHAATIACQVVSPDSNDVRTMSETIDPHLPALLCVHLPVPRSKQFTAVAQGARFLIKQAYPQYDLAFISGNGAQKINKLSASPFRLQVSCFYPLHQIVEEPAQKTLDAETDKHTPQPTQNAQQTSATMTPVSLSLSIASMNGQTPENGQTPQRGRKKKTVAGQAGANTTQEEQ